MKYTRRTEERKANQKAKMGGFSERSQKNGFCPNGPVVEEATSITRPLVPCRWAKAEERITELISCIQPNQKSEKHRNDVASYVKRLISKCIPCQVFTYGSVPLKTYLPDGDIDLTVFSEDHNLKDNWAKEVQRMLQIEEKNEQAEFPVQEVQLIQAEVKIIKCLVDNIVVDISFNQLGGLCTLCFLEEVDNLISKNHLFKRSIILVKAWCYYESRILGAHHALISTYALETLILYIFHIFNNSFAGPLEVLYRFLEFFSKFDWAKFCVSLWGPVPISSLPNMAATPPRKDGGDLLLSKDFLDSCGTAYSVIPAVPENREIPFTSKHLNVIDPLRLNNNLGRSVSKGNFYRIRSAFSFGAQELGKILECPLEDIVPKLNQFFFNTLDRHGKGFRPDAPVLEVDESHNFFGPSLQPKNLPPTARTMDSNKDLSSLKEKDNNESKNHMPSRVDHFYTERSKLWKKQHDDIKRTLMNTLQTNGHVMHNFARTSSSPELTSMSNEAASRNSRRMIDSGIREINVTKQFTDEPSLRESSSRLSLTSEADHSSGNCVGKLVSSSTTVVISSAHEPKHRCAEEQNFVNKSFIGTQHYGGHPQMPANLASHSFVPYPPSVIGYSHPAYGASIPTNMSAVESDWGNSGPFSAPFHQQFRPVREIDEHDKMITGLNERLGSMKVNHPGHVDEHSGFGGDCYDHSTRDIDEHDRMIRGLNERLGSLKVNHVDEHSGFGSDHYDNSNRDIDPENGGLPSSPSSSSITKAASENSWDGKLDNLADPSRYPVERRTSSIRKSGPTTNGRWEEYGEQVDHSCNDDLEDCAHLSSTESITHSVTALPLEVNRIPGFGQPQMSYQNSMSPFGPLFVNPGSHQGIGHNHPVFPVAFYPAGPHVPFVTMVPIYNVPGETGSPGEPMNNSDCSLNHTGAPMSASGEHSVGRGSDIFNSDFINHWNNLQYGRHCQGSQLRHPIGYSPYAYPPPILVPPPPPPLEGSPSVASPGRSNAYTHAVPNSAPQRGSVKPAGVSRREQVSKQRNGTGTYFPNPNMIKERQWSSHRQYQGDYDHDRIDNYEDREANWNNWNSNSKPRHNGRGQPRKYYEKQNTKIDRDEVFSARDAVYSLVRLYLDQFIITRVIMVPGLNTTPAVYGFIPDPQEFS